jgi:hypothetical protein
MVAVDRRACLAQITSPRPWPIRQRVRLTVTPVAAIAAGLEVDPIFAAIKHHIDAWRAFGDTCPRIDEVVAPNEGREAPNRTRPHIGLPINPKKMPSKRSSPYNSDERPPCALASIGLVKPPRRF